LRKGLSDRSRGGNGTRGLRAANFARALAIRAGRAYICAFGRGDMVARQAFRDGMARFAAAVTVVTTDGAAGRAGLTATAVTSVSDDPPTLLVCVNRAAHSNAAIRANGTLCVNVLVAGRRDVARRFSDRAGPHGAARFQDAGWTRLETGAPALEDALVSFDCRVEDMRDVGTHTVIFARVVAIREGAPGDALLYAGRDYHELPLPALRKAAE